jgi:hypothetical protein
MAEKQSKYSADGNKDSAELRVFFNESGQGAILGCERDEAVPEARLVDH